MSDKIRDHHTAAGKFFYWFKEKFESSKHNLADVAIQITEVVKSALQSGVLDTITEFTSTDIDNKVLQAVREKLPVILTDLLLWKTVNAETSAEDSAAINQQILDSFGGLGDDKKEQFYSTLGALIHQLQIQVESGEHITFGQAAKAVEDAYQAYLKLKETP